MVTNNINIANILLANPDANVIVTGGALRRSDMGLVGYLASKTIEQFNFDIGVISCSALNVAGDILDFGLQEVEVSHAILRQSRQVVLAADQSKFERKAPARIGSIADVDVFVTDHPVAPEFETARARHATQITYALPR